MIDFPTSPVVGTTVTSPDGLSWTWDGFTWNIVGGGESGAAPAAPPKLWAVARIWPNHVLTTTQTGLPLGGVFYTNYPDDVAYTPGNSFFTVNRPVPEGGAYLLTATVPYTITAQAVGGFIHSRMVCATMILAEAFCPTDQPFGSITMTALISGYLAGSAADCWTDSYVQGGAATTRTFGSLSVQEI